MKYRDLFRGALLALLICSCFAAKLPTQNDLLIQAVTSDDVKAAERLLASGASPNARNVQGRPVLLVAALKGSATIVTMLIEKGAAVDLGANDDGFTALMGAAATGNAQIVRNLLASKAAVDARDSRNSTALMAAAFGGHADVVSILLFRGASIDANTKSGITALMLAASQCRVEAVRVLWNAGANFRKTDRSGNAVWTYAKMGKCPSIVRVAATQPCKDMSTLYSIEELTQWESTARQEVIEAKAQIISQTIPAPRELLSKAKVLMEPPPETCMNPFESIRSFPDRHEIDLPTFSLKFVRDLLFAKRWLVENGYRDKTPAYVNMLKYRRPSDFPDGRYPPPLDALGVPHDRLSGELRYDTPKARDLFRLVWNGALFFIVAHEAGHVVNDWQSTPEEEAKADSFAVELLSRYGQFPGGVVDFFLLSSYFEPSGADFEDLYQYQTWLRTAATHPPGTSRVNILADSLLQHPERYLHIPSPSDTQLAKAKAMSSDFKTRAGAVLVNITFSDLFSAALRTDLVTLAPERDGPMSVQESITKKWTGVGPDW